MESSLAEKEFQVQVGNMLIMSQQCDVAAKKASSLLGCIRQGTACKWRKVIHSALVRDTWNAVPSAGLLSTREAVMC